MKIYTIKDIADIAGVGISTVSRVLNNRPDVNDETRKKVLQVIEKYNYSQNNNAKHLKQRNTKFVLIIVRGKNSSFLNDIIEKMQKYINNFEYHFLIEYIDETANEFDVAKKLYAERKIEGIIFLGGNAKQKEQEIKKIRIPCVYATVDARDVNLNFVSSVSIDDRKAGKFAIDYLFDNGHRNIAVIGSDPNNQDSIGFRFKGVQDSFREHGLEFKKENYIHSTFSFECSYKATKKALDIVKNVTAIFAMSDIIAIGAAKAVFDSSLKIPDDISIIGFDGIELTQYYNPTITTIKQPAELIAQKSIELIVESIVNSELPNHIIVDTEFILGNSVKKIN